MTSAKLTPIAPQVGGGIFQFTAQTAGADWFGPGTPLTPQAQEATEGRIFDFPTGLNLQQQPKVREGVTFAELRGLADGYDLLRLVIETRKDQIEKLAWGIRKRGEKAKRNAAPEARVQKIVDFLQCPDQEHTWGQWLRMLLEDLFVLDAPTVYRRRTKGGDLFALEPIDGSTIKRILDPSGRTPLEGPAYQQVLKGMAACEYTRDDLLYMPRNPRTHRVYGYGPVEQIITTINIALRRQLHQMSYYTEGNTPNLIFGVPKEWTPEQIRQFQNWWDSLLAGNSAARARARFVPGEVKPLDTKEQALKDEYDEWLARIVCYAFSVSAQPFIKQMNRSTAETAAQQAAAEGLAPIQNWIKGLMDWMLRNWFEAPDLEFQWETDRDIEPLIQSQRDQIDTATGVRDINECREDRGLEPLTPEELEARKPAPPPMPPAFNAGDPAGPIAPDESAGGANSETKGPKTETKPKAGETNVKKCHRCDPDSSGLLGKGEKGAEGASGVVATRDATTLQKAATQGIKPINRGRKSMVKLRKQLAKTLTKYLAGQVRPIAEGVVAGMAKLEKASREDALEILGSLGLDFSELGEDIEPIISAMTQDGGSAALAQLGKTTSDLFDQVSEQAVAWAEDHAAQLVTKIAEVTREKIAGDIGAALELGMSVDELADALADSYAFSEDRAELIAQTELAFADVRGNCIAYGQSGVVGGLIWIVANAGAGGDARTCEDCDMNDGARVPMEANGEASEAFPSGATTVPAHPGCLCDLLPDLNETEE